MKVYVLVDMEGISGIVRSDQVHFGETLYKTEGRRYLTADVNACIEGCFTAGADQVLVKDDHGGGLHMLWDQVDPRAEIIQGTTYVQRMPFIDECDACILLGQHAMAGTQEAILEHTMSSVSWQNFWLNGRKTGEIGIDSAIAGENGVPTIMISGDDKACREAEEFIPGIVAACVKYGLAVEGGRLLSADAAHKLITGCATEAVQKIGQIKPHKVEPPVTARLERVSRGRLPVRGEKPYVKIIDGRTYEVTGDSVEQALWRLG